MKLRYLGVALVLGAFLFAPVASATEFLAPQDGDGSISLPADQTHGNTYIAGGAVTIDSIIDGDLFAAGGTVTVGGEVRGDVFAAGGTVILNNTVTGDVRVAGGTVNINAPVNGDLLIGGGTVVVSEKAVIGGEKGSDVLISGGTVVLSSSMIRAGVRIYGGQVRFDAHSLGDLRVEAEGLTFGPKSSAAGKITYKGPKEAIIEQGSNVAGIEFHKVEPRKGHARAAWAGIFTIGFLVKILATMLAAFLFLKLRPRRFRRSIQSMYQHPWSNLGLGLLFAIVIPIASLILLLTFVGWYIALIAFLLYGIILLAAGLLAAVFLGTLILKWLTKKELQLDWQAVVIGVVVLAIVQLIPIVGWLVCAILFLMAFGALMRLLRDDVKDDQVDSTTVSV